MGDDRDKGDRGEPRRDESYNERADEFMRELQRHEQEDPVERAGRHHVEAMARYATQDAVVKLAQSLARVSEAQMRTAESLVGLSGKVDGVAITVTRMQTWMEGTVTDKGTRTPGFIDSIAAFHRWRDVVSRLLWVAASGIVGLLVVAVVRLFLDHGVPH